MRAWHLQIDTENCKVQMSEAETQKMQLMPGEFKSHSQNTDPQQ